GLEDVGPARRSVVIAHATSGRQNGARKGRVRADHLIGRTGRKESSRFIHQCQSFPANGRGSSTKNPSANGSRGRKTDDELLHRQGHPSRCGNSSGAGNNDAPPGISPTLLPQYLGQGRGNRTG